MEANLTKARSGKPDLCFWEETQKHTNETGGENTKRIYETCDLTSTWIVSGYIISMDFFKGGLNKTSC